jgi:hypothetical protein
MAAATTSSAAVVGALHDHWQPHTLIEGHQQHAAVAHSSHAVVHSLGLGPWTHWTHCTRRTLHTPDTLGLDPLDTRAGVVVRVCGSALHPPPLNSRPTWGLCLTNTAQGATSSTPLVLHIRACAGYLDRLACRDVTLPHGHSCLHHILAALVADELALGVGVNKPAPRALGPVLGIGQLVALYTQQQQQQHMHGMSATVDGTE